MSPAIDFSPALRNTLCLHGSVDLVARSGPAAGARPDGLFADVSDPSLLWYLPAFRLVAAPDTGFSFTAARQGVDADGNPYNTATVTLTLERFQPDAVRNAGPDDAGATYQEISPVDLSAVLQLGYIGSDGDQQQTSVGGSITEDGDRLTATVMVIGKQAVLAFTALTTTGTATVHLDYTYRVAEQQPPGPILHPRFDSIPSALFPIRDRTSALVAPPALAEHDGGAGVPEVSPLLSEAGPTLPQVMVDPSPFSRVELPRVPPPAPSTPPASPAPAPSWVTVSGTADFALGSAFAAPSYRPRYTLTGGTDIQVLVSADQLREFDVQQSEYIELTALGDIASRFPSLRAVYLGAVSGTVVAVPAAYGIIRTSRGCAAECDALLDSGAQSARGCRFQLSFGLGPVVDVTDLAGLAAALAAAPSLQDLDLHLTLPSDLDSRTPAVIGSPLIGSAQFASAQFGVGLTPHTFLVTTVIADDDQPAITKANLFLRQLVANGAPPLLGRVAVRLDDAFPHPVFADVILNLHATSGSDDLAIDLSTPGTAVIRDNAPVDLRILRWAAQPSGQSAAPNTVIAAGAITTTAVPAGTTALLVDRALELPDPFPPSALSGYLTIRTEDVQRVHHTMGVNATGVDFTALAVATITIDISLDSAPQISVPRLTLDPTRRVDQTAVDIPAAFAISGLSATLIMTVTADDPAKPAVATSLTHDFVSQPVLVLGAAQLKLPVSTAAGPPG